MRAWPEVCALGHQTKHMAFPLLGKVDFSTWTVGELATSSRGQKSAPVFADSRPTPHLQLTDAAHPMTALFGASA